MAAVLRQLGRMLQDLVAGLDRRWDYLSSAESFDFVVHLFSFHDELERDSRTASILRDLRSEEQQSIESLVRISQEVGHELVAIVSLIRRRAPGRFDRAPEDPDDDDESADGLHERLQATMARSPADYAVSSERDHDDTLSSVIQTLDRVVRNAEMPDVVERLSSCKRRLDHAYRVRRIFWLTSGATSLVTLERHLADCHPSTSPPEHFEALSRIARMHGTPLGSVAERIFGVGSADPEFDEKLAYFLAGVRDDARRVYEEIRTRLGAERSLLAVIDRYRQRCQWYDAARLRKVATSGPGKPEDRLVDTLATYLFDQGLNPLTQPLAGLLRPDLLGAHSRFSFYVEAKQYKKPARAYLRNGMRQVWDMLDQLRGTNFDVREAFYVVYRLEGPRYTFPPRLEHGGHVVHVLMIDLTPPSNRGSRAPATEAFSESELLPVPVGRVGRGRGATASRRARGKP